MIKYCKNYNGFTYVEAILTVLLTLLMATSISYAVVRAQTLQKSLNLKERAFKELKNYTNEYRTLVAFGERPLSGKQPRFGHEVILFDPSEELKEIQFGVKEGVVAGRLYHIITDRSSTTSGDQSGYYNIKTWIEWTDTYTGKPINKHLAVEVDQAILKRN